MTHEKLTPLGVARPTFFSVPQHQIAEQLEGCLWNREVVAVCMCDWFFGFGWCVYTRYQYMVLVNGVDSDL